LRSGLLVPILHFMGGSAAEIPTSPDEQPIPGLRASDADRDEVVARLRDEFVAGRLSQETFLHRMHVVLESRQQADLPPLVADLPPQPPAYAQSPAPAQSPASAQSAIPARGGRSLAGWLRGTWSRVSGAVSQAPRASGTGPGRGARKGHETGPRTVAPASGPARSMTTGMRPSPDGKLPLPLQFPRGGGSHFSIGRDASCDLAIADMTISRRHAQLERTPEGWLLSDLESTNGTRVNGWRVRGKVPVRAGDLVSFGTLEAVFATSEEAVFPPGG
jgi:hypothetical protein